MRRWFGLVTLGLATAWIGACGSDPANGDGPETRALMGRIYHAIRVLLPESARPEPFSDPANSVEIEAALDLLAASTEQLEGHVRDNVESGFLARSVARDARDVARAHAEGKRDRAAFLVRKVTENCIVCHSRLPDDAERTLAIDFLEVDGLEDLPPEEKAALQMATRRFDDARRTLEAQLASSEHPAMLLGSLTDYLVISIRIQQDYSGPVAVLRRFARRADLWAALRGDVEFWIEALPRLEKRASGKPRLATAREIAEEARGLAVAPGSHRAVAHYVVASSILVRFLEAGVGDAVANAEAYYLLGLTEAWIGRNYWVTSAPFLFETAIRTAPGATFARDAYSLLERETLQLYEGADEEIPVEDATNLAELRALIDAP
jgi:hypothetical protein